MSTARKQSLISLSVWFVLSVFLVLVFTSSPIASFSDPDNSGTRLLVAIVILPGFILNMAVQLWAKRARKTGELDERDEMIANSASEITLIILAILIFILCIVLYETYRGAGVAPVGWFYLMAYGTTSVVSLIHPAVSLVLDYGGKVDG